MVQWTACLLGKHEDLSWLLSIHAKSWAWQHAFVTPVLGRDFQKDPGSLLANESRQIDDL